MSAVDGEAQIFFNKNTDTSASKRAVEKKFVSCKIEFFFNIICGSFLYQEVETNIGE
jgi:hypothetical protein